MIGSLINGLKKSRPFVIEKRDKVGRDVTTSEKQGSDVNEASQKSDATTSITGMLMLYNKHQVSSRSIKRPRTRSINPESKNEPG